MILLLVIRLTKIFVQAIPDQDKHKRNKASSLDIGHVLLIALRTSISYKCTRSSEVEVGKSQTLKRNNQKARITRDWKVI